VLHSVVAFVCRRLRAGRLTKTSAEGIQSCPWLQARRRRSSVSTSRSRPFKPLKAQRARPSAAGRGAPGIWRARCSVCPIKTILSVMVCCT
jgi:hypothetical protein